METTEKVKVAAASMLQYAGGCTLGCDPEFFFKKDGKIIGSEKVIPKEGLQCDPKFCGYSHRALVLDGVQVELHTTPGGCRQGQGSYIVTAFKTLKQMLAKPEFEGIKPCFDGVVTVTRKELETLSEDAKTLGCLPSLNYYDKRARVGVKNPSTYRKRSAGGHIHMGLSGDCMKARERLVPILDVILGNTCVLLDRDPKAAERRRHYGRAGEYRLPKYGLEYRVLSNFWLRSYPLMSFVMAVARQATYILGTTMRYEALTRAADKITYFDAERELLKRVDIQLVRQAINKNDVDLAWKNWEGVKDFFQTYVPAGHQGLSINCLNEFEFFARRIQEKGMDFWFPEDAMANWTKANIGYGWESFAHYRIHAQIVAEAVEAKQAATKAVA